MKRLALLFISYCVLLLCSCGVKAPPIAPEMRVEEKRVLNCSPQDPKCDVVDPNYKPRRR